MDDHLPTAGPDRLTLVDDNRMRIFRDDYGPVAEQLVALFEESTPPLLAALRAAGTDADEAALRRAAHQIKGSCLSIGASFMATVAQDLEHGGEPDIAIEQLHAAFAPTNEALRRALSLPTP